jgi:ubiquinone/menaquinone biosynthesis C-methylase UbiE
MAIGKFNPDFFKPFGIDHAKKIILMDNTIPNQWESETEWTINFFSEKNLFTKDSIVLDWGCGIGRLAKPIIEKFNCKVVGVDFQPNMLKHATEYVNNSNFTAISNEEFFQLPDDYFTVGISIWALMHTMNTTIIIEDIQKKLNYNSRFCVFDSNDKAWPIKPIDIHDSVTEDDILLEYDSTDICDIEFYDSWASSTPKCKPTLAEIIDYFSIEKIGPFPSKEESDTVLSTYLTTSWWGIFINDRKYFCT